MSPPSLFTSSSTSEQPAPSSPRTPPQIHITQPMQSRGRKYPTALGRGGDSTRVPLHRRGKSRTYERLEDLLREAGYKETRVVTPQRQTSTQSGVMRFLQGLVGGATDELPGKAESWSLPASPSLRTRPLADERTSSPLHSDASSETSFLVRGRQQHLRNHHHHPPHHPHHHPHERSARNRHKPVYLHLPPERAIRNKPSLPTYAEASPARAYLRHMASAPHIARASSVRTPRRCIETAEPPPPPLPPSWLETVTRALLGLPGAHIGGPGNGSDECGTMSASTSGESTLRPSGSRVSAALVRGSASTRAVPSGLLLTSATPAAADVAPVRVVCRSAPASRAASRARREPPAVERGSVRGKGKKKAQGAAMAVRVPRPRGKRAGPSLTGRVEDDVWDESESSDEDEEGEVDLTKLLVSPKRQMSIQSLRRHLGPPGLVQRSPPLALGKGEGSSEGEWEVRLEAGDRGRRRLGLPSGWRTEEGE
ncbi:hypothetical protein K488DRAFT_81366 [Vararia minispora EC-137]|uniref:Uncharacterized protein n=1 Tax=Vararia minispora EC-137 TaxID=1314806 RepID=A0ACB8R0T3_9AGAM|nr:hypothetical protein K488DRAFT_81366 [Vararia minispora EC-137]